MCENRRHESSLELNSKPSHIDSNRQEDRQLARVWFPWSWQAPPGTVKSRPAGGWARLRFRCDDLLPLEANGL